jgi:hypothetical protein
MDERERRRANRRRRAGKDYPAEDLGNGVEVATAESVMRAVGSLPRDLDWDELAPSVIPVLPRRRPMPLASGEPFRVTLPPGISTGFGIDIGPAFLVVGTQLMAGWAIEPVDLVTRALGNLRERMRPVRARDLVVMDIEGVQARVLQTGLGCASALVLIPDELRRIFGQQRQRLLVPMRDLVVSLPPEADPAFAAWLNEELATMDPNGLALDAFVLEDGGIRTERLPWAGGQALSPVRA